MVVRLRQMSLAPILFALAAAGCVLLSWRMQTVRPWEIDASRAVSVWLAGMAFAVLAVWQPTFASGRQRLRAWTEEHRRDSAIVLTLFVAAAISQFVRLGTHPWVMHSDEGFFALGAVDARHGRILNPFSTGFLGHPVLYFFAQAQAMSLFGETVFGARAFSALQASIAVPICYLTALRLFRDRLVAVWAALLLGTHVVFLFWGRHTLNNISSMLFVLLIVLLLDMARDGGPSRWLGPGLAAGVAQYTYYGVRLLPFVVLAYLVFIAIQERIGGVPSLSALLTLGLRFAFAVAGFVVAVAPIAAFYRAYPVTFGGRMTDASIFSSGWLDRELDATGESAALIIGRQFVDAALFPFELQPNGQFRGDIPFIGWPLAMLSTAGLVVVTTHFWRRPYLGIVISYWGTVAGMALTMSPYMTHRWVMALPPLCLAAAAGMDQGLRGLRRLGRAGGHAGVLAGTAAVAVAAVWSLILYFHDPIQRELYTDPGAEVGDFLAAEVTETEPHATVYFGGAPQIYYRGQGHLMFKTPFARPVDLLKPLTPDTFRLPLIDTTVFVFLPFRIDELEVVRAWYPWGRYHETSRLGTLLYVSYTVEPPPEP